jgi:cyclopropane fatty-acyl-phospholipid synthase-like methyltransferase
MKTSVARRLYRLVPARIRKSRSVKKFKLWAQGFLPHNWVYDETYYSEAVEETAATSSGVIANSVLRDFRPKRLVDVGCGTGAMLEIFRDAGVEVLGLEKSKAALRYCRSRQLNVREFDLEHDTKPSETFDVVTSMEVAEHLPGSIADRYIDLLTTLGSVIVFTAAPPGQGGTDHVNEQPPEYWIRGFAQRGFTLNAALTNEWQAEWKTSGRVTRWYHLNLMVFHKL